MSLPDAHGLGWRPCAGSIPTLLPVWLLPPHLHPHLWPGIPEPHNWVDAAGGEEAVAGVRLQAVDDGLVPLEHADQVGGLLFPDEEGAIVRATDDVLSVAGRGAKGREVRWGTARQPQAEAVWLRARRSRKIWSHSAPHTQGSPVDSAHVVFTLQSHGHCLTILLNSGSGTAWVPLRHSPPKHTLSSLGARLALVSLRSLGTPLSKPSLGSPSLPGSRPPNPTAHLPSHTNDI